MVYENNPFPTKQGTNYLQNLFDLIYRPDKDDPSQLAQDNVKANRDFFNSHKSGLVNITKRFIGGYEPVLPGDSQDSGIYVCDPKKGGCGRADFMYNWHFIDAGLYDAKNWIGTVDPKMSTQWSQTGYPVVTRVRCNDYNQCLDCYATFATANKGSGQCIYCGSSNLKGGGCGKEHMAVHMVREQTIESIDAQTHSAIRPSTYVTGTVNGKLSQIKTAKPFAFRVTCGVLKKDTPITNYKQAAARIPSLEVGYRANSDGINFYRPNRLVEKSNPKEEVFFGPPSFRGSTSSTKILNNNPDLMIDPDIADLTMEMGGTYYSTGSVQQLGPLIQQANDSPSKYPISKMRYAFTWDKKMVCNAHNSPISLWGETGQIMCMDCGKVKHPYTRGGVDTCRDCGSTLVSAPFNSPRPLEDCPQCGHQTDPTNLKIQSVGYTGYLRYPRKKLLLRPFKAAGQPILPLDSPAIGKKLNTYMMLLVTDDADDTYSYEIYVDGKFTTIPIPSNLREVNNLLGIDDDDSASGSASCPKDPMIDALGNPYNSDDSNPTPTGVCELPDGDYVTTDQLSCDALNGDYKGDGTEIADYLTSATASLGYPQSGVTFPGFSWIVCEGRTQSCYIGERRRWVDNSVPNASYRDPKTGEKGKRREYPRFTIGPSIDPRAADETDDSMKTGPKYLWMKPKTHIMMDIFGHASVNLAKGGSSNVANNTHDVVFKGMVDNGLGGSDMILGCKTCLKYYKVGMDLAMTNDENGAGNPLSKPWTDVGGAKNLQEAWNNGKPEKYYPGVEVLIARKRFGTVTGWTNPNTPTFKPRRIGTYSEAVLLTEIENVQGENGWWFWIHDATMQEMYKNADGTYII